MMKNRLMKIALVFFVIGLFLYAVGEIWYFKKVRSNEGGEQYAGQMVTEEKNLSEFEQIRIKTDAQNITIVRGPRFSLKYSLSKTQELVRCEVSHRTLFFESKMKKWWHVSLHERQNDLTVTIPEGVNMETIVIERASGDVRMDNIKAERCEIRGASGDVKVLNADCRDFEVRAASSDVDMSGHFGRLNLGTASGDCQFHGEIELDSAIKTASGDIVVQLTKPAHITTSTATGKATYTLGNESVHQPNLKLVTASGEIEIK